MKSNQKMHIAFINQDMYRLGAQYVTALVAKGLVQRGHKVDLLLSAVHDKIGRERPDLKPFSVPDEVRIIKMPNLRASRNILAIRRYLRESTPDFVIPMCVTYESLTALAARLSMVSTLVVPVEHSSGIGMKYDTSRIRPSGSGLLYQIVVRIFGGLAAGRIAHMIAVSNGVKEALMQTRGFSDEKVSVVYNPVVDSEFYEKRDSSPSHPWLQDKQIPVIVAAGAHVPFKGYDVLLKAFAQVLKTHRCRLIMFGEGWEEVHENLKLLAVTLGIQERVSFPGHVANLPANLKAADAFVISSHCESFSVVLVEALACGVPVVSTNCPSGPPEILADGKYGILVEPDNPESLAQGLRQVLDGKGIEPPDESWQPYCLEKVTENYEAVLRKLLQRT